MGVSWTRRGRKENTTLTSFDGRRLLLVPVLLLGLIQTGLGLTGLAWGYARGWASESVAMDEQGNVISRTHETGAEPWIMVLGGVVATGGAVALASLLAARRRRLLATAGMVVGAVLGLPLGYTIVFGLVPILLAALGVLAIQSSRPAGPSLPVARAG